MDVLNNHEATISEAIHSGDFEQVNNILLRGPLNDPTLVSNTLVQATYLLWVKSTGRNTSIQRMKQIRTLKSIIKQLLQDQKADPNVGLLTAFHYCIQLGEYDLMKLFLENGATPSSPDTHGNTALHLMCMHMCEPAGVRYLLTYGGQMYNTRNNLGQSPLHTTIEKFCGAANHDFSDQLDNIMETIMCLLRCHKISINLQDKEGKTPLFLIYEKLHTYHSEEYLKKLLKISTKLLESGTDINLSDRKGQTVIHKALEHFWLNDTMMFDFAHLLLNKNGIDVNVSYFIGTEQTCPLVLLFKNLDNFECYKAFNLMHTMILKGAYVQPLLDCEDYKGRNILHILTISKMFGLLKALLKDPMSVTTIHVNQKDHDGNTPLDYIYKTGYETDSYDGTNECLFQDMFEVVQSFLQCGVKLYSSILPNVRTVRFDGTVDYIDMNFLRHTLLFLRAGFKLSLLSPNKSYKIQHNFLLAAIRTKNLRIVEWLVTDFQYWLDPQYSSCYSHSLYTAFEQIQSNLQKATSTLQSKCGTVIRFKLYPNALCSVMKLKYHGRELPSRIKDIILAADIDSEYCSHLAEEKIKMEKSKLMLRAFSAHH